MTTEPVVAMGFHPNLSAIVKIKETDDWSQLSSKRRSEEFPSSQRTPKQAKSKEAHKGIENFRDRAAEPAKPPGLTSQLVIQIALDTLDIIRDYQTRF